MNPPRKQWQEYGEGGDTIGARRLRWSFRFSVLAALLLAFSLWYVENFMREDLMETQYRSALTLHPASARPVLRNVIATEARNGKDPTPKYLLALAAVEEDDKILPMYEAAFKITPSDTNLLINYGAALFITDNFQEARDRFREAGIQAPDNALPRYLEAAALAASSIKEGKDPLESGALVDALALIERGNSQKSPLAFPKPLWHPSLPTDNNWHNMKRREIINRCCAPLYKFESILMPRALNEIEAGRSQHWDAWLDTFAHMGQRLVGTAEAGADDVGIVRAQAGLHIQENALRLRKRIRELNNTPVEESLVETGLKIEDAMKNISTFESKREKVVQQHAQALSRPLILVFQALLLVGAAYIFAWLLGWVLHKLNGVSYAKADDPAWTVQHPRWILGVIAASCTGLAVILFTLDTVARGIAEMKEGADAEASLALGATVALGLGFVLVTITFGLFYAALKLPSAQSVLQESGAAANDELLREAQLKRRLASVLLMRRYAGIHFGLYLVAVCIWFLLFRLLYNAYPSDVALLTVSLRDMEVEVVRTIQASML